MNKAAAKDKAVLAALTKFQEDNWEFRSHPTGTWSISDRDWLMANSLRFALVGITIIIGANVLLAVRDSKGLKMLQERNEQICQIDPTVCQ